MTNEEMNELDKWLAENVMGWKLSIDQIWNEISHFWTNEMCWTRKPELIRVADWQPTRNITQAFEVVEMFRSEGWSCELYLAFMGVTDAIFRWIDGPIPLKKAKIKAKTPALAICLAAKKAWEAK